MASRASKRRITVSEKTSIAPKRSRRVLKNENEEEEESPTPPVQKKPVGRPPQCSKKAKSTGTRRGRTLGVVPGRPSTSTPDAHPETVNDERADYLKEDHVKGLLDSLVKERSS